MKGCTPRDASAAVAEEAGTPRVHQVMARVAYRRTHAAAALAVMQAAGVAVVPAHDSQPCTAARSLAADRSIHATMHSRKHKRIHLLSFQINKEQVASALAHAHRVNKSEHSRKNAM